MSVDVELTSDELDALAGNSMPRWAMVHDTTSGPNVVATARVNAPGGLTFPLRTIPVDGTSAGWANIAKGMVVFFGSIAGGFDGGIYRVRKTGTGSTIEIMSIGDNDAGETTFVTRDNGIVDDDYITILYSLDIFGVFPRIDYPGSGLDATIYEDGDLAYDGFNQYPPPIINVFIAGRSENYATNVLDGTSDTFDIDIEIQLWPTSASADWEITLPTGVSLNSGSLTGSDTGPIITASINVTAAHSADNYVIKFEATEDNGSIQTSYRKVWIKSNTYPPIRIVRIETDEDGIDGSRRTVTLNQLVNMRPGALVHLFDMGTWGGGDVPSAIHAFSGYCISQRETTEAGLTQVTMDLVGPSIMLQYIGGQSQIMEVVSGDPANYQEIVADLSYIDFIIWWIMAQRVAGLLQMFNCTLFGFSNTEKRMTAWQIDTGTLFEQIQHQAQRIIGGNFGCDPGGEIMLRIRPSRVWGLAARNVIPTRCSLAENQYTHIDQGAEMRPQVRRLRTEAFYSDATTVTPVWADAPPIPGQGRSEEKLDRLIVDSPTELYRGTGLEYAARNNKYPNGTTTIKKNYAVIKPAQMLRVFQSTRSDLHYDQIEWSAYTLVTRVSRTHNADGTIDTTLSWEAETSGVAGVDAPIPSPDSSQYNSRYQSRPFAMIPFSRAVAKRNGNTNPAGTKKGATTIPKDGSVGFCGTATHAYIVMTFLGTPTYRDVTPSGLGGFQIKHGMVQIGGTRAWLLVCDGTDSKVYTTANVFATPRPTWTAGTSVTGIYTEVRAYDTAGSIAIYAPSLSPASGAWSQDLDFTTQDWGFVRDYPAPLGSWTLGTGWHTDIPGGGDTRPLGGWSRRIAQTYITTIDIHYTVPVGAVGGTRVLQLFKNSSGTVFGGGFTGTSVGTLNLNNGSGTFTGPLTVNDDVDLISVVLDTNLNGAGQNVNDDMVVNGTTNNPFITATTDVRYSSNNGSTWSASIAVGDSPGSPAGFDVQKGGTVSYVAAADLTRKATTLGGGYSDNQTLTANPKLIEIPWAKRNALTANNTGSSPEYIIGLDAVDGSGNTLYWVVGGSPVDISPVIGGSAAVPVGSDALCTWLGKYVAMLGALSGNTHLLTSNDGGATWADHGTVNAAYMRLRRLAKTPGQLYMAGATLKYSPDFGKTIVSKTKPSSTDLVFFEPYG